MAEVYLAEDEELGRKVALKMLNERHARDDQFVERFKREARNAAGLSHPHIVRIYDRGQAEGTYYIAMEYLDGQTLKELLVRKGPCPPLTAIKFAREILSALAEAHRHEIVHRDIKPHNVIVSPDWNVKVTDFGIARSGASQMTEAGSIVGTAQYLSPEQARGKPVDQRSDLYSLGIVLYEMLTGRGAVHGRRRRRDRDEAPRHDPRPAVEAPARGLARPRRGRDARAREGPRRPLRLGRGDGRRPGARRARRVRLAPHRGGDDAGADGRRGTTSRDDRGRAARGGDAAAGAARLPAAVLLRGRRPPPLAVADDPRDASRSPIAAVGGYLVYHKVSAAIDKNAPVAVQQRRAVAGEERRADPAPAGAADARSSRSRAPRSPRSLVISQNPAPGDRVAKDTIVTLDRVERRSRRRPCPTVVEPAASRGGGAAREPRACTTWSHNVPSGKVARGQRDGLEPGARARRSSSATRSRSTSRPGRRRSACRPSSTSRTRTPSAR